MSTRALARPAPGAVALPAGGKYDWIFQIGFLGLHVPLAMVIPKASSQINWHARVVILLAALVALTTRRWERVACAAAYITGAEVYWRMRHAQIPWETGKYAVILVVGIALLRMGHYKRAVIPGAFFLLLVPSALLTIFGLPDEDARSQLAFNLSGPLALAVCAAFFKGVRFSRREMKWIMTFLVAPTVSIATVASVALSRAQQYADREFNNASNKFASGGFGPNQVSAALGLGILAIFLIMVIGVGNSVAVATLGLFTLFLIRQCVITFSRGGIYMAAGGVLAASYYLARDRKIRMRLFGVAALVAPLLVFVVWPRLETMTAGKIGDRFANTDSTGRDLLVLADLKTWSENIVLGAGPGMGGKNRLLLFHVPTAHTEYSRMLAEHGMLGLLALVLMGLMAWRNIKDAPTMLDKALAASMLAYSLLSMLVDGRRLVRVSFAFGISGALFLLPRRRAPAVAPKPKAVPQVAIGAR